jgi:oligo-1,6-glucosidase
VLNFSAETPFFELPAEITCSSTDLLIGNYPVDPAADITQFELQPYEARVYQLN